jgi:hypothetical protein
MLTWSLRGLLVQGGDQEDQSWIRLQDQFTDFIKRMLRDMLQYICGGSTFTPWGQ